MVIEDYLKLSKDEIAYVFSLQLFLPRWVGFIDIWRSGYSLSTLKFG